MRVGFVFIDSTIAISVLLFICQTVAVESMPWGWSSEASEIASSLGPIRFATAIGISEAGMTFLRPENAISVNVFITIVDAVEVGIGIGGV